MRPGDRLAADLEAAGLDARHVEQLEDQPRHAIDLVERDVQILLGRRQIVLADERLRELRVALDRRDRRAQLVRGDREELVLQPREIFDLAPRFDLFGVELRVFDGQRGALGEHLASGSLSSVMRALGIVRGDDERAEHFAARAQRKDQQRGELHRRRRDTTSRSARALTPRRRCRRSCVSDG